jgi:hypothetical protein
MGILCLGRIEESKISHAFRGCVIDGRKNNAGNFGLGAVPCSWKRRLAKLDSNNPCAISDSHSRFKTNIAGVKRLSARVPCTHGSGVSRERRSTGLLKWDVRTLRTLRRCAS